MLWVCSSGLGGSIGRRRSHATLVRSAAHASLALPALPASRWQHRTKRRATRSGMLCESARAGVAGYTAPAPATLAQQQLAPITKQPQAPPTLSGGVAAPPLRTASPHRRAAPRRSTRCTTRLQIQERSAYAGHSNATYINIKQGLGTASTSSTFTPATTGLFGQLQQAAAAMLAACWLQASRAGEEGKVGAIIDALRHCWQRMQSTFESRCRARGWAAALPRMHM